MELLAGEVVEQPDVVQPFPLPGLADFRQPRTVADEPTPEMNSEPPELITISSAIAMMTTPWITTT